MKELAFLLLLDYSGSMDQQLQDRGKIEILKEETGSLLSTALPEAPSMALVFGTKPENKCKDVEVIGAPTKNLSTRIRTMRPGNQGRTPLAFGLRQMVRAAVRYDAKMSVVVTDGADSCGEDPCKALIAGDAELGKVNKKLRVEIIGFDLKNESKKFQCFKNLKLKNIDINMNEAGSKQDLANRLKASQQSKYEQGLTLSDKDTAGIKGLKKSHIQEKGSQNGKGGGKSDAEKNEALVEIVGAPSTSRFSATNSLGGAPRDWQGSYIVTLRAGDYTIKFDDANNGSEVRLSLGGGTHTKIPWARLMKNADCSLQLQSPTLAVKWVPSENTRTVHGQVDDITTVAEITKEQTKNQKVPFGQWTLEVTSPPWLKGRVRPSKVEVYAATSTSLDVENIYRDQIEWIENPHPDRLQVLSLKLQGGVEDRYPIQPGMTRVPIPKGAKAEWLGPGN